MASSQPISYTNICIIHTNTSCAAALNSVDLFFALSDFLMNSLACVTNVFKNAGEGNETACKCTLAPFSPLFDQTKRAPSLAQLLACLFHLSAWKSGKGHSCSAGYEFRFDLVYHSLGREVVRFLPC